MTDHRNITRVLQAAVCLYDALNLPQLLITTCHFDHDGDTTQWSVFAPSWCRVEYLQCTV